MDEIRITKALEGYDIAIDKYLSVVDSDTALVKQSVRRACLPLKDTVTLDINSCEVYLSRSVAVLTYNAEYHLIRAYFHASPSLIVILTAIYGFIITVVQIISTINTVIQVITGQTLAFYLDKIIPGFAAAWKDIMNKVSEFSGILGWGVDGVHHMLNAVNASSNLWGMVGGKSSAWLRSDKLQKTQGKLKNMSDNLALWQRDPGERLDSIIYANQDWSYEEGVTTLQGWFSKIDSGAEKIESVARGVGDITNEFLALQNDMPAFIAKNIPQAIWDGLTKVDSAINDRILPALTGFTDRLDELDAVLDSYQKKAAEIAERLAHPGDLLAEIDKLPGYARQNQLVKIDGVTSQLMKEGNDAAFVALEGDLTNFARVAAALSQPPAPLSFMELELPGRSPGITPEPHESWFLEADY